MNFTRTATIVVVGGAVAAWFAGAATSNRPVPRPIVFQPTPIEARSAELANEVARLHERLRPDATPNQPGRNLFSFRPARARAPEPAVAPPPVIADAPPPPARPAQPSLKLVGIAEDEGQTGPERTAIISGEGQLFMVKEGDAVTLRYRVTKISADVVELTDLTDNSARRLALK